MNTVTLQITARDPIVSRDGRPFGSVGGAQGNRMRSVGWPLPSVVAGSLRTALGKRVGREFSQATATELLATSVAGLFPMADGRLYLPAPHDCVVHEDKGPLRARPRCKGADGCDWPAPGLRPVMVSLDDAEKDFKPEDAPAWWPLESYANWLADRSELPAFKDGSTFLGAPSTEERTHVALDPDTGAAAESLLFTTSALPLRFLPCFGADRKAPFCKRYAEITLRSRVEASGWASDAARGLDDLHPLGGERRLVHWQAIDDDIWKCPGTVATALGRSDPIRGVRMDLLTPAIFDDGWKPGWLDGQLTGTPPGTGSAPVLRLVGVTIQRWRAVSGWSLAEPRGPKAVRRMVPAGGVYFFKVVNGNAADLASRWFESVSDREQDRRDGFGLAAWGIW